MIGSLSLLVLVQFTTAFQFGDIEQSLSLAFLLETAASIFSLVLFFVTIYAWNRRGRQRTLLIVSFAFLAYFSKLIIEILPVGELHDDLISSIMDFVTLGLFFIALVVKPQRGHVTENNAVNKNPSLLTKRTRWNHSSSMGKHCRSHQSTIPPKATGLPLGLSRPCHSGRMLIRDTDRISHSKRQNTRIGNKRECTTC